MSVLSSLQKAEKEITIEFPINKVKEAVMQVFKKLPNRYLLRKEDINETFNTYRFPATNALYPGMIDLTLQDIDGVKTKVILTATALHGSVSSNTTLSRVLSDYLSVLGKILSGEPDEVIKEPIKQTGCMVFLLIGLGAATLMSFILI